MKVSTILLMIKEKILGLLKRFFVATESDPILVRKKHVRLGVVMGVLFLTICYFIQSSGGSLDKYKSISKTSAKDKIITKTPALTALAKGTENEMLWVEKEGKQLEELRQREQENTEKQLKSVEELAKNKIGKEELAELLLNMRLELEQNYNHKLAETLAQLKSQEPANPREYNLDSKSFIKKKKIRKLGEYIPANTYVSAKLISGVDAGIGMLAEANPRQILIRITGEAISAGLGAQFLKTDKLIGCQLSAKAVGDISSEKAYLDGVLMTCALDKASFIEIPVKAWITSNGKSGVRGEIVSREGDMVLKSFLAGLASGFGGGISQATQPQMSLTGAGLVTTGSQNAQSIVKGGLGAGISNGGDKLSEYFIKRAEQYQPVISINEGVDVTVVFQEGFSLKMEPGDEK
jgi:conjugal transfer pilus assembly protein TraB